VLEPEADGELLVLEEPLPEPYWLDDPELLPVCDLVEDGLEDGLELLLELLPICELLDGLLDGLELLLELLPTSDWLDRLDEPVWELVDEPLEPLDEPY
jgi:hypothetical protein